MNTTKANVDNRLDSGTTTVIFYKTNGTVSVLMSFQPGWAINKDATDMICAIPTGFYPSIERWINSHTANTNKNIQFNVRKNNNDVWCLYLTPLDNLVTTDRINDSFLYQI